MRVIIKYTNPAYRHSSLLQAKVLSSSYGNHEPLTCITKCSIITEIYPEILPMKTPEHSRTSRVSQIAQSFCPKVLFLLRIERHTQIHQGHRSNGLAVRVFTDTHTHTGSIEKVKAPIKVPVYFRII